MTYDERVAAAMKRLLGDEKPKEKRGDPESRLQREVIALCRNADGSPGLLARKYPGLEWIYAVPNGARRSAAHGAKLKAEGMLAGVWDLFLPVPGRGPCGGQYLGLYLETKTDEGRLTQAQQEFGRFVQQSGYATAVYRSLPEFVNAISAYFEGRL